MEQLDLLTIRKQPAQREPEIPHRVIKAYVKANLRDFANRQAERERQRAEARKREKPRTKRTEEHQHMRTIRVTYRAVFQQPIGELNPMGVKLPGDFPVELFQVGAKWQAREIASARRQVYEKLGKFASLENARTVLKQNFERCTEPWQIWGIPPMETTAQRDQIGIERMLLPDEICSLGDGKFGWYGPEDRTHIIHAPTIPSGARIPPAACGVKVNAKCFIDNRANVEPTCKGCAEVWRREYQNK